jgi:hypothetical protein
MSKTYLPAYKMDGMLVAKMKKQTTVDNKYRDKAVGE